MSLKLEVRDVQVHPARNVVRQMLVTGTRKRLLRLALVLIEAAGRNAGDGFSLSSGGYELRVEVEEEVER